MLTNLKRLALGLIVAASLTVPALGANSLYDFSTSEPSNSQSGGVNTAENQAPSTVNDGLRNWKQLEAAWLDDLGAVNTVAGTSTAITVTLTQGFTGYGTSAGQIPNGAVIAIKTGSAATGATTLNVNAIGTKAVRLQGDVAVQSGDWASGAILTLRYDTAANAAAGAWIVLDSAPGGYTGTGAVVRSAGPTITLANGTGLPIASGVSGLGTGVATFLATPSSANARTAITDETGTGVAVFGTAPTFTTSINIGAANTLTGNADLSIISTGQALLKGTKVSIWGTASGIDLTGLVSASSIALSSQASVGLFSNTGATRGTVMDSATLSHSGTGTGTEFVAAFYNANGNVGLITTAGTGTNYATSSDKNLKKNFRDFDSGAIVDAIKVYNFDWKNGGHGYGVKAQELYETFPDAVVKGSPDELYGTPEYQSWAADYSKLVPVLLREIQDLRKRVSELEAAD